MGGFGHPELPAQLHGTLPPLPQLVRAEVIEVEPIDVVLDQAHSVHAAPLVLLASGRRSKPACTVRRKRRFRARNAKR